MKNVRNKLLIGIEQGASDIQFFTKSGLLISIGYTRVVIGQRGPYVEFDKTQIKWCNFFVPEEHRFRFDDRRAYYLEYRSCDTEYVKLYHQKRTVAYADYRIDMCYVSPFDLLRSEMQPVILN